MDFPVAQTVKRLPTMQETQVQSLGQEDLLEKETATYSSILAWKIPWMEEPGRATVHGVAKSWTRLSDFTFLLSFMIWSTLSLKKKKNEVQVKLLRHVRLFATTWTVTYPGSSIHGIFQARILEWVVISFSRGSSRPRDQTQVSHIAGRCFINWPMGKPLKKKQKTWISHKSLKIR